MQGSRNYLHKYFIMKHHKRTGHLVMCENSRYENTTFRSFLVFSWYFWHPLICMLLGTSKEKLKVVPFFLLESAPTNLERRNLKATKCA